MTLEVSCSFIRPYKETSSCRMIQHLQVIEQCFEIDHPLVLGHNLTWREDISWGSGCIEISYHIPREVYLELSHISS